MVQSVCPSVCVAWEWWEFRWSNKWNWYSCGLNASILVWHTCASALSGWVLYRQLELTKLTCPDLHHVVGLFILKDVCQSLEYPCTLRMLRTCPHSFLGSLKWFNHFAYIAWEWWEFRWSNKWNWYSCGLNASILVWHTCASALSGWVLYRQLELTKLTRPDLHHVMGLFILKDVRPSHLFDYVTIIVSSWKFLELLPMTEVMSMQKVKVRGQRSRSQRSTPNLAISGP